MHKLSRSLEKHLQRLAIEVSCGLVPGMPGYFAFAKDMMPLDILLGDDVDTFEQVRWRPGEESNGFLMVLGASGSGKTEALKTIGHGCAEHGVPVLVLDFHGDVVFPGLESFLMSSGSDSWMGINPMAVDGHDGRRVGLYDRRMALVEMIRRAVPALGARQQDVLSDAMEEAYARAGINDQVASFTHAPAPTFIDVIDILQEWATDPKRKSEWPRFNGCVAAVKSVFGHPVFKRPENLTVGHILQRNIRLDLSQLTEGMQFLVAETVLRMVFNAVRLQGPVPVHARGSPDQFRLFIILDEAKIMSLGKNDPDDLDCILNRLFTECRKYGIGLVVASQMRNHFGSEVRANAAKRLVLKPMDALEARRNADIVQVAPEALLNLKGSGEGFLSGGGTGCAQRIQVRRLHG